MTTKLFLVERKAHITSIWTPTGDPRTPLIRRWIHDLSSCDQQEGGLCLCA